MSYTKFHLTKPVLHSPGHIFTRIGKRASAIYIVSQPDSIFQVDLPTRLLCAKLLSDFISYNHSDPGTFIDQIIKMNLSPVKCIFRRVIPNVIEEAHHDGVVESLRFLILHENFIKPYFSEHIIAFLLTKAFWTWVTSLMIQHADGPLAG